MFEALSTPTPRVTGESPPDDYNVAEILFNSTRAPSLMCEPQLAAVRYRELMTATNVTFPSARGQLSGYLATPTTPGPWPSVVVIFDVTGLSADTVQQCDWLASQGFRALAPDLYRGQKWTKCVRSMFRDSTQGSGPVFDDISATKTYLDSLPLSTGRSGVIGFCMGGGFALLSAAGRGFNAASVNYGTVPKKASVILQGACPVVASYGGRDRSLRGAAEKLDEALTTAGVIHDVKEYVEAGHGFLNDHRGAGDHVPLAIAIMGTWAANGFHEAAAADAKERITAFFREHLST